MSRTKNERNEIDEIKFMVPYNTRARLLIIDPVSFLVGRIFTSSGLLAHIVYIRQQNCTGLTLRKIFLMDVSQFLNASGLCMVVIVPDAHVITAMDEGMQSLSSVVDPFSVYQVYRN